MSSSRSSSSTSSWAERKLARQRQMEMMEAVASGTAPTMELDTLEDDLYYSDHRAGSTGGAGTVVDYEQNIRPHAFADVSVQPYIRGTRSSGGDVGSSGLTTSGGAVPSSEIFERPQVPTTLHGVNLMDHRTGVYREPTTFTENVSLALTSVRDLFGRPELYDASPSDDYIGQGGGPGGGGTVGTLPRSKKTMEYCPRRVHQSLSSVQYLVGGGRHCFDFCGGGHVRHECRASHGTASISSKCRAAWIDFGTNY